MMKILLVCSAGMSTSLMVEKMKAAAEEQGIDADISASAEADLAVNMDGVSIVLLGPQVRYLLPKMQAVVPAGVPVEVIYSLDYGMMNGAGVLQYAVAKIQKG